MTPEQVRAWRKIANLPGPSEIKMDRSTLAALVAQVRTPMIELDQLLPGERIAHTVTVARMRRGESLQPNTTAALALALLRLMGEVDGAYEVIP